MPPLRLGYLAREIVAQVLGLFYGLEPSRPRSCSRSTAFDANRVLGDPLVIARHPARDEQQELQWETRQRRPVGLDACWGSSHDFNAIQGCQSTGPSGRQHGGRAGHLDTWTPARRDRGNDPRRAGPSVVTVSHARDNRESSLSPGHSRAPARHCGGLSQCETAEVAKAGSSIVPCSKRERAPPSAAS